MDPILSFFYEIFKRIRRIFGIEFTVEHINNWKEFFRYGFHIRNGENLLLNFFVNSSVSIIHVKMNSFSYKGKYKVDKCSGYLLLKKD